MSDLIGALIRGRHIAAQALPRQQIIRCLPSGKRRHAGEPTRNRGMAGRKVVARFVLGERQVSHHGDVGDSRSLIDRERPIMQMGVQDAETVVDALLEEGHHFGVGRRRESPVIAVRGHVAGELVVVPEQPAQDLELLIVIGFAKTAITLAQAQQDRRRLGKPMPIFLQDGNLAHRIHFGAPFRRARDAAAEVGPHRLERLTTQGEHERELVAVARLGKIMQSKLRHLGFMSASQGLVEVVADSAFSHPRAGRLALRDI